MMMEQRDAIYPCFADVSGRELEVAEILIQLPDMMISQLVAETPAAVLRRCINWGCKRKRDDRRRRNNGGEAYFGLLAKAEALPAATPAAVKVESLSPDTPLDFEPSEFDYKPQHLRQKLACKREREKWLKKIDQLNEQKESIEIVVRKVKRHRDNLMAHNLQLKARKEGLMRLNQKEEEKPRLEIHPTRLEINPNLNQQVEMPFCQQPAQQSIPPPAPSLIFYHHPGPHIMDQTAQIQTWRINDSVDVEMRIVTTMDCNSNSGRPDRLVIKLAGFNRGWILAGLNISDEEAERLLNKKLVWTPKTEELQVMFKFAPTKRSLRLEFLRVKKSRYHSR